MTVAVHAILALLPGALLVYLSFNGGGFFAGTTGLIAMILAIILVLWITTAERPFEGINVMAAVVAGALALFGAWVFLSAVWSDAPARALVEFDRVLLYLLGFIVCASVAQFPLRLRVMVYGVTAGAAFVVCAGLFTRVLPDVWSVGPGVVTERLSYPLTYWNALGLLGAVAAILCFHLASSEREPRVARLLGAAVVPLLSAAVYFTLSRGAILVGVLGLVVYAALARPRGLLGGLVATAPTSAIAVVFAYDADLLVSDRPTSAAAVQQGHDLVPILIMCALGAVVLRALMLPLDERLTRVSVRPETRRMLLAGGAALCAVVVLGGAIAVDAPGRISDQYERFVDPAEPGSDDARSRLVSPANNGRIDHWDVSLTGFEGAPLVGTGAGTYLFEWARDRPNALTVNDGHSLYIEALGELGLIGLLLIVVAIVGLLIGVGRRIRGPDRALPAAVFAAVAAWALHAGIDWDWEMPAVTLWAFMVGGAVVAAPASSPGPLPVPQRLGRIICALAVLILALTPALIALSQRQLDASVAAFKRQDCKAAISHALSARELLAVRPEPFEILGFCDAQLGFAPLGVRMMEQAVDRDPKNWQVHYGLALALALAGRDPRPQAREALRLNPRDPLTQDAVARFRNADTPAEWKRRAVGARLPIR